MLDHLSLGRVSRLWLAAALALSPASLRGQSPPAKSAPQYPPPRCESTATRHATDLQIAARAQKYSFNAARMENVVDVIGKVLPHAAKPAVACSHAQPLLARVKRDAAELQTILNDELAAAGTESQACEYVVGCLNDYVEDYNKRLEEIQAQREKTSDPNWKEYADIKAEQYRRMRAAAESDLGRVRGAAAAVNDAIKLLDFRRKQLAILVDDAARLEAGMDSVIARADELRVRTVEREFQSFRDAFDKFYWQEPAGSRVPAPLPQAQPAACDAALHRPPRVPTEPRP